MSAPTLEGVGIWTPRKNLVNGYVLFTETLAAKRYLTTWNAECNIRDLDRMFPTQAEMLDLCRRQGVEPLAFLPPKEGPGYPPTNPRLRHWRTGPHARPHWSWREYEGEPCEHRWIVLQSSGYDCNDCCRHFGMYD